MPYVLVQAQVKEFLAREEETVEERVREFEKRERDSFARLQNRTLAQRTLLFAAIDKARESAKSHQSQPPPSHTLTHSPSLPPPAHIQERVTITLTDASRPLPNKSGGGEDALFSLDGFDEIGVYRGNG